MPFPSKEIQSAYEHSLPIFQGHFKEDPDVLELGTLIQQHYEEIKKRVDAETLRYVNGLTQLLQEGQEYQCRHGFTEGWLMAKSKSENTE